MSGGKYDTLKGLAASQTGPLEKIQNGDPKSGNNRDQRAQTLESGGPKASLQTGATGTPQGQLPAHANMEKKKGQPWGFARPTNPTGVTGTPDKPGNLDRAGTGDLIKDGDPLQHGDY